VLLKDQIDTKNGSPTYLQDFPFSPFDLLYRIVRTLENVVPSINRHHERVALVAAAIAMEVRCRQTTLSRLVQSCLIHDVGVFIDPALWKTGSTKENEYWENIANLEEFHRSLDRKSSLARHSLRGYHLLKRFGALSELALPVLLHHYPWRWLKLSELDDETKTIAGIINVADRIAVILAGDRHPLSARADAVKHLRNQVEKGEYDPYIAGVAERILHKRKDVAMDIKFIDSWKQDILYRATEPGSLSYGEIFEIFDALAHITDAKSPFTLMHTTNVLYTASALAQEFGLPEVDVLHIELAALAHDLGKIATPNSILHKEGPLNENELPVMQEHVYISFLILKDLPGLRNVVFTGATHHERLDGSGYPWGLTGAQLTQESRILQVADVYSAMREDRPYRGAIPHKDVLERLGSMASNGLLDAKVVKTLKKLGDTFQLIPESVASSHKTFSHQG
jgi:HD-GYP domain-containing protein (c-di-GMP phosphodiesterase class II)